MKLHYDISELNQFRRELNTLTNNFSYVCKDTLLVQKNRLIREVQSRTPVKTGELKKAWVDDNIAEPIVRSGRDYSTIVQNNKPYALVIERGKRKGQVIQTRGKHMLQNSENVIRNDGSVGEVVRIAMERRLSHFD